MTAPTIGVVVHDFFLDYLSQQKGLRPQYCCFRQILIHNHCRRNW